MVRLEFAWVIAVIETWQTLRQNHKTFDVFPLYEESLRDTVVTVWDSGRQGTTTLT